ncbi:hypothetical protein [Thiomicrorhabdus heinhorstiae]|uniref:Uncharacterized protein n=1 Tax=Thiomicrorhabdus heinhorstiae TaxID=2748010 RepID=A0ABS0BT58_9GAMM|nr:hypothetical protein [Thiomicrorhabdus heinhorstiae]MBF6057037.1 hypothetical protein [Thiomicrorhabdus heinhorstiae]
MRQAKPDSQDNNSSLSSKEEGATVVKKWAANLITFLALLALLIAAGGFIGLAIGFSIGAAWFFLDLRNKQRDAKNSGQGNTKGQEQTANANPGANKAAIWILTTISILVLLIGIGVALGGGLVIALIMLLLFDGIANLAFYAPALFGLYSGVLHFGSAKTAWLLLPAAMLAVQGYLYYDRYFYKIPTVEAEYEFNKLWVEPDLLKPKSVLFVHEKSFARTLEKETIERGLCGKLCADLLLSRQLDTYVLQLWDRGELRFTKAFKADPVCTNRNLISSSTRTTVTSQYGKTTGVPFSALQAFDLCVKEVPLQDLPSIRVYYNVNARNLPGDDFQPGYSGVTRIERWRDGRGEIVAHNYRKQKPQWRPNHAQVIALPLMIDLFGANSSMGFSSDPHWVKTTVYFPDKVNEKEKDLQRFLFLQAFGFESGLKIDVPEPLQACTLLKTALDKGEAMDSGADAYSLISLMSLYLPQYQFNGVAEKVLFASQNKAVINAINTYLYRVAREQTPCGSGKEPQNIDCGLDGSGDLRYQGKVFCYQKERNVK